MINASTAFKTALANDQRNYIERAEITLTDGTVLNLDNSNIWQNGFSMEDAVSSDNTFDVGAAIINKASLTINNIYDDFSEYDFDKAKVVMYVGLDLDGTEEMLRKGTYIVDEADYNGEIIKLSLLDYMSKFDVPYSNSQLSYPATLGEIVRNACSICDVTLNTPTFPHSDVSIPKRPNGDSTTFREVVAAAAQIAGCFARCNTWGELEIKWYDQQSLEQQYSTLDGGTFDDGAGAYKAFAEYFDTTDGMTIVLNTRVDDATTPVTGVSWFTFDGYTANTVYVNSNSWVNIGKTANVATASYVGHLNICKRDGSVHKIYRQEGTVGNLDFLKIRFEGYTRYQTMYAEDQYAIQWELFLLSNGKMLINMLRTPSSATYIGVSSLVTSSQSLALTLAKGNGYAPLVELSASDDTWSAGNIEYESGDVADGGIFKPWNVGYVADTTSFDSQASVHHLYSIYSLSVSTDNVVITGVRTITKYKNSQGEEQTRSQLTGSEGYVLALENNCLLDNSIADTVRGYLGAQLIGLQFRKASVTHSSDPTIEAGDVAILYDRKYRSYPFLVTQTNFSTGSSQKSEASAETPTKNSAARYSLETKNYVALRQQIIDEKTDRETALEGLAERLNETSQMYITNDTDSGGNLSAIIIHNKPTVIESDIVWKITTNAFGVSTDGGKTYNLGATADGDLIARVLTATGVNANWVNTGTMNAARIKGGTLTLGGSNNGNGWLKIVDASGNQIGKWDNSGITINKGTIAGPSITLGGSNNTNGTLTLKNASNQIIGTWNKDGLSTTVLKSTSSIYLNGSSGSYLKMPFWNGQLTLSENDGFRLDITNNSGKKTGYIITDTFGHSGDSWFSSEQQAALYWVYKNTKYEWHTAISPACVELMKYTGVGTAVSNCVFSISRILCYRSNTRYFEYNAQNGDLHANGKWIAYESSSSERYKHDITDEISEELDPHRLYELPMKQFVFNEDHPVQYEDMRGETIPGFIAEDVAEIYPSATIHDKEGRVESWDERRIIPGMLALIQEQKKEIDELKAQVQKLTQGIEFLMQERGEK